MRYNRNNNTNRQRRRTPLAVGALCAAALFLLSSCSFAGASATGAPALLLAEDVQAAVENDTTPPVAEPGTVDEPTLPGETQTPSPDEDNTPPQETPGGEEEGAVTDGQQGTGANGTQPGDADELEPEPTEEEQDLFGEETLLDGLEPEEAEPDRLPVNIQSLLDELYGPGGTILTDFDLAFYDEDDTLLEEPTISARVEVQLAFFLPEELRELIVDGDYYEVQLSEHLRFATNYSEELYFEGVHIGGYEITTGGLLTFYFTDEVQGLSEVEGRLEFWGRLNAESIDGPGTITVLVPGEEELGGVDVVLRPETESMLEKKGWADRVRNPDEITWQLDANKSMQTLQNAIITDAFPAGTTYLSAEVYSIKVDLYGNVVDGSETPYTGSYTVGEDGTVTFPELSGPVRIYYHTTIDNTAVPTQGGDASFKNDAYLTATGLEAVDTWATVTASYGYSVVKTMVGYDSDTQIITWAIRYNYSERDLDEAYIIDAPAAPQVFLPGSVKVYPVTFNEKGEEQIDTSALLSEGSDYTVTAGPGEGEYTIRFPDGLSHAVFIEVQTRVEGIIDGSGNYMNYATDQIGHTSGGQAYVSQRMLRKGYTVDYDQKILRWNITVNGDGHTMYDWNMKDEWTQGQTYNGDLVVTDTTTGGTLTPEEDYTVQFHGTGFILSLLKPNYDPTDHKLSIAYSTTYNTQEMGTTTALRNTATSWWDDEWGNPHTNSAWAQYAPEDIEMMNGAKSGSYNAVSKEITWELQLGYAAGRGTSATLVDSLENGQNYVENSLVGWTYTVNPSTGWLEKETQLTEEDWADFAVELPSEENDNTLTITIPPGEARYWFEFRTSLEGRVVHEYYENTATLYNDEYEPRELYAKETITNGGRLVGKTGYTGADGYAWWDVTLNASQSTIHDMRVVDTPSENQTVDLASLGVYEAIVDENGGVSMDENAPLTLDEDYTVSYAPDENGLWQLVVEFPGVTSRPYILTYRVQVVTEKASGLETLSNQVTVSGMNEEEVTDGGGKDMVVDVGGGSGIITGTRGGFTLQKLDGENGRLVPGAAFTLHDESGAQIGSTLYTGDDGTLVVGGLVNGRYYTLKEVAPAEGYQAEAVEVRFMVNAATTNGSQPIDIANTPNETTLTKLSPEEEPLEGAAFQLERHDAETDTWSVVEGYETVRTGENGTFTLYALPDGEYRLLETGAPEGYLLDEETYWPFTIARGGDGLYPAVEIGPVYNEAAQVQLAKVCNEGNPLEGALFGLQLYVGIDEPDEPEESSEASEEASDGTQSSTESGGESSQPEEESPWQDVDIDEALYTDANGYLSLECLPAGRYRLVELEAPYGYLIDEDEVDVEFTITGGETVTIELGPLVNQIDSRLLVPDPDPDPGPTTTSTDGSSASGSSDASSTSSGAGGTYRGGGGISSSSNATAARARYNTGNGTGGSTGSGNGKVQTGDNTRPLALLAAAGAALGALALLRRRKRR